MNRFLSLLVFLALGSLLAPDALAIRVGEVEVHISLGRDCKKVYVRPTPGTPLQERGTLGISSAYVHRCAIGVRARTAEGAEVNQQFAIIYDVGRIGTGVRIGSVSMTDIYGKGELSLIYDPYACGAVVVYSSDLFGAFSDSHSFDDILARTTVLERFRFSLTPGSFKFQQCPGNYR